MIDIIVGALSSIVVGFLFKITFVKLWKFLFRNTPLIRVTGLTWKKSSKGYGIGISVKNIGNEQLPPYRVTLCNENSEGVNISWFEPDYEEMSSGLPFQIDTYYYNSNKEDDKILLNLIDIRKDVCVSKEKFDNDWILRLILKYSDNHVIFQSREAGVVLARELRKMIKFIEGEKCDVDEKRDKYEYRIYASNTRADKLVRCYNKVTQLLKHIDYRYLYRFHTYFCR